MDELCRLDFDRLSAEMQAGMKPYRDISEVAVTAAILAADARMIPSVYKDAGLNEERRHAFDQLANKLHDETLELNELAKNNDLPKIRAQLNQVVATCNACHASFRGPKVAGITKPTSK
jgi:cytochrome c556